jgi:hypothetical protein
VIRSIKMGALALGISLALTACDPPMPPEMLVEIAEREYVCQDGSVTVAVPESLATLADGWSSVLAEKCPTMFIERVGYGEPADIILSAEDLAADRCVPFMRAPWAIDAAAIVVYNSEIANIQLSPDVIADIFAGNITDWSDPAIAELNPDLVLSPLPIVLDPRATKAQISALEKWFGEINGTPVALEGLVPASDQAGQDRLYELEEGTIGVAAYVDAFAAASTTVSVIFDEGKSSVAPDNYTVASAATQMVGSVSGNIISAVLDPSIPPTPPQGIDTAATPYQALVTININLCGEDTLLKRAVGRYLLRADTQGNVAAASGIPVPEAIRIQGVDLVMVGLPAPIGVPTP